MKKSNFIKEWRASRGEDNSYLMNFIYNFCRSAYLMHKVLPQFRDQKGIIQESIRNYIISTATCLETFYRDLLIFVLSQDETTLERVLPDLREKTTYSDIHSLLQDGIKFAEIAVADASFQNISEIETFMSKLFFPNSYLQELDSFFLECFIPARSARTIFKLDNSWRSDFAKIFIHRHSFVHDANKVCDIELSEIRQLETIALLVPQLTTYLIANKFSKVVLSKEHNTPVIFIIEDIISDDWEVVPDEEAAK
jgi:hypothetical protein